MSAPTVVDPSVAWLSSICNPARADVMALPFAIDCGGERWTVATNGWAMAARRGDYGFAPRVDAFGVSVAEVLFKPFHSESVSFPLADARALIAGVEGIAPPDVDTLPPCDECGSTGKLECDECIGLGYTPCTCRCGDEHETDCEECDGNGWVACVCGRIPPKNPEKVPCQIGIGRFDLRVLASIIPHLPNADASWTQDAPERQAKLVVGEWTCLIMPLRTDTSPSPKFTLELGSTPAPRREGE